MEVLVKRPWRRKDILASFEAPLRPGHRLAGGWIADHATKRHAISLCSFCTHKFNPKSVGYQRASYLYPWSIARCDDCKQVDPRCRLYVAEETWDKVFSPRHHGRRGRWALDTA